MAFLDETGLKQFKSKCDSLYLNNGTNTIPAVVTMQRSTGDTGIKVSRTDTGNSCTFEVGSGGTNRGIWDNTLSKWIVYADASTAYLNGNASTATALASSAGSWLHPSYISSGKPAKCSWGLQASTFAPSTNANYANSIWVQY